MKVIFLGLNGRGGTLHYCSHLATSMAKIEEAEIYTLLPSYSDTSLFSKDVKLIRIPAPPNMIGTLLNSLKFWKHIKLVNDFIKLKPDIVHILDIHPWYIYYIMKLKKKGIPIIITINDPELHSGENKGIVARVIRFITKYFIDNGDKIIVHGEKWRQALINKGLKQDKVFSSHIGAYEFFKNKGNLIQKDSLHKEILFFGRIQEYKGIDTLIRAVPLISKEIPEIRVTIAGEGNFEPYKKLIQNPKHYRIINKFVPDDIVDELFTECDIVVMPYNDATQSGLMSIGYAYKKPIIASNVGAIPEIVDDGMSGVLIPPKNPQALAEAVIRVLKDKELANRLGEAGHKKLKDELNWDAIAIRTYKKIYNLKNEESI